MYITRLEAMQQGMTVSLNGKEVDYYSAACDEFQRGFIEIVSYKSINGVLTAKSKYLFGDVSIDLKVVALPSAHTKKDDCEGSSFPMLESDMDW